MTDALWWMTGLLGVSALFSGSEAALFTMASRPRKAAPLFASSLLRHPQKALMVILMGNLVVNISYFSWSVRWSGDMGAKGALAVALGAVLALVMFGEILPKVLAHRAPRTACRILLPPVWALNVALGPLAGWLARRFAGKRTSSAAMKSEEIDAFLESEGGEWMVPAERDLLRHVLEFGILRCGELRRPLVEVVRVPAAMPLTRARQRLREQRVGWAPVVDGKGQVVGLLDLTREMGGESVADAMRRVPVLPELAPVARAIEVLRDSGAPFVLLVDEYGADSGLLERGRFADTLLDRLPHDPQGGKPAVEAIGDDRYRVEANLPLHVFRERFADPGSVEARVETVAGLLAERLGRLPRLGDRLVVGKGEARFEIEVARCKGPAVVELRVRALPADALDRGVQA